MDLKADMIDSHEVAKAAHQIVDFDRMLDLASVFFVLVRTTFAFGLQLKFTQRRLMPGSLPQQYHEAIFKTRRCGCGLDLVQKTVIRRLVAFSRNAHETHLATLGHGIDNAP